MNKVTVFFRFFLFLIFELSGICTRSQEIKGIVRDASNGTRLEGTYVFSPTDSTFTDSQGRFDLTATKLPFKIIVQSTGYKTDSLVISDFNDVLLEMVPEIYNLSDVVIFGGFDGRALNQAPASISLVTDDMIARDDPLSIVNSLNRVPGVYMHSGSLNTNRITIRGIGSRTLFGTNKIKAYFNEIPLTDGSGNSTIEDIDQQMIGRIEVTRGPTSSIYGAGLGGVIRLEPVVPRSNQTSFQAGATIGSFSTHRYALAARHHDTKQNFNLVYTDTYRKGYRENSTYRRRQLGLSGRFRLDARSSLSYLMLHTKLKAFIPSSIGLSAFNNSPQQAAFTWGQSRGYEAYDNTLLGLTFTHSRETWVLKTSIFGKIRDAYEPRPFNILDESTHTLGTRTTLSRVWGKFEAYFGLEAFADQYRWKTFENLYDSAGSIRGELLSNSLENRTYINTFFEATFKATPALTFTTGVNFNTTNYQLDQPFNATGSDQSGNYRFDPVWSPKIAFNYRATQNHSFFGNISHGFSPPSLEETLYPDGQINPNIQPESGWNYEVGGRGLLSSFHYDISFYFMDIRNLLVAQRTAADQYIGVNAGRNAHLGTDILINYPVKVNHTATLNVFTSFSYMHYRFREFINDGENYQGNQLTGVPTLQFSPGIELNNESGLYGNITGQFVGETPVTDSNDLYSEAYLILRCKAGYKGQIGNYHWDIYSGINNLSNSRYASMLLINATGFNGSEPRYYYPGDPRNYYLGFSLKYVFDK